MWGTEVASTGHELFGVRSVGQPIVRYLPIPCHVSLSSDSFPVSASRVKADWCFTQCFTSAGHCCALAAVEVHQKSVSCSLEKV